MYLHKLIIEDEVPLMITYKFNMLNELVIHSFINVITRDNIPQYRPQMNGATGTLENSQYNYGIRILNQHLVELDPEYKQVYISGRPPRKK